MGAITSILEASAIRFFNDLIAEVAGFTGVDPKFEQHSDAHITYLTGDLDDLPSFEAALRHITAQNQPFKIRTTGLGIFTGAQPILYVNVVGSPLLRRVQTMVWNFVRPHAKNPSPLYQPEFWMPHITIGWGDSGTALAEAMRLLAARDFSYEILIDSLSVFFADDDKMNVRLPFLGKRATQTS